MIAIVRSKTLSDARPVLDVVTSSGLAEHVVSVLSSEPGDSEIASDAGQISIETVYLPVFGWSLALNAGLRSISARRSKDDHILLLSTTVRPTIEELRTLMSAAEQPGASCGYALFEERREISYVLPRNTLIVWKRSVLQQLGPFDESLDDYAGMEDYEMVLRAFSRLGLLPNLGPTNVKIITPRQPVFESKLRRESEGIDIVNGKYERDDIAKVVAHLTSEMQRSKGKVG
jgi:hypothetical protein